MYGAMDPKTSLPRHVAVIMDGNGRWATRQGKPRIYGHQAGTENIREVIKTFADAGVKYVTLFAFSTENWARPAEEISALLTILQSTIDREVDNLHQEGVQIRYLGNLSPLHTNLREAIKRSVTLTRNNTEFTLNIAFNYGGRAEILEAVNRVISGNITPEDLTEQVFSDHLYTAGLPDPDLIIRTGGEMRLSNFLLWQAAYSEFYTSDVCWPDFKTTEIQKALEVYRNRQRRFGRLED